MEANSLSSSWILVASLEVTGSFETAVHRAETCFEHRGVQSLCGLLLRVEISVTRLRAATGQLDGSQIPFHSFSVISMCEPQYPRNTGGQLSPALAVNLVLMNGASKGALPPPSEFLGAPSKVLSLLLAFRIARFC
jgi:hypothetical protein